MDTVRPDVRQGKARDHAADRGPSPVDGLHPEAGDASARSLEHIRTIIVDDHDDIARLVANRSAAIIRARQAAGNRAVLGLATGSTPIGVYRELIRLHQAGELSFANVVTFNLDEYYPMPATSIHSYARYMWENLFAHVDTAARLDRLGLAEYFAMEAYVIA